MIPAYIIILISLAGLVLILVWFFYRLRFHRRKRRRIEELSCEIREMEDPVVTATRARRKPGEEVPDLPEDELLVIFHRGKKRKWKSAFRKALREGGPGMIITTTDPKDLIRGYKGDLDVIWLNRSTAAETEKRVVIVNPTNLSGILDEVETSLCERRRRGIIMLDRFEEVIQNNDPKRVVRFLNALRNKCRKNHLSAIAPLNYKAVPQRVRSQLSESFDTVVVD